jgi:hypothetical protein
MSVDSTSIVPAPQRLHACLTGARSGGAPSPLHRLHAFLRGQADQQARASGEQPEDPADSARFRRATRPAEPVMWTARCGSGACERRARFVLADSLVKIAIF